MKKLLSIICLSIPFWMMGQSIRIINSANSSDVSNGQITASGSYNSDEIVVHLAVKNTSAQTQSIYAKKRIVSTIAGTEISYCFAGDCYTPLQPQSNTISMVTNAIDSTFSSHYIPNGQSGVTVVTYTFYAIHGDSVSVNISYDATSAGVENNGTNLNYISIASPNPANTFTTFSYSLKSGNDTYLSVYNILGSEVKRSEILFKSGTVKVYTSDLKSGLYFCSFISNGKVVKTQKFTIAR